MKKKILIKRVLQAIGVLFLVLVVTIIVFLHYLTGIAKNQAERQLSALTDGQVKIYKLDLSIRGKANVERMQFYDKENHQWLQIAKLKISLENWPSFNPSINAIEIDGVDALLSKAKLEKLYGDKSTSVSAEKSVSQNILRKLTIQNLSITLQDYGLQNVYDNISITADNSGKGVYDFSIERSGGGDFEKFRVLGKYDASDMIYGAQIEFQHKFIKEQIELPLAYLDVNGITCEGTVAADIKVSGKLDDVNSIKPEGIVRLRDFNVLVEGVEKNIISTDIKLNSSGVVLDSLHVRNSNEIEWLYAKQTDLFFKDWPGFEPALNKVNVNGLNLLVQADANGISLPLEVASHEISDTENDFFNLEGLQVHNASIGFINKPGSKLDFDSLLIQPAGAEDLYEIFFDINRPSQSEPNIIKMHGFVNPNTTEISMSFEIARSIRKDEASIVCAILGYPEYEAQGRINADMVVNGLLKEPCNLRSSGRLRLSQFEFFQNDKIFAQELEANANLTSRVIDFNNISAVVCEGPINGRLNIEFLQDNSTAFSGKLGFDNVNFHKFLSFFGEPESKNKDGKVTGEFTFLSSNCEWNNLEGEGSLAFINVDATVFPVIPALFSTLGLAKLDPLTLSDAECKFSFSGPVVTFQEAHMANTYGALEVEPSGRINLQTHQLDLYVIAVLLRQVDKIVRDLPVADIIFNLRDKLTRFYIKGDWSSSPAKLISKTPIKDVTEGTVGFIGDVIKNGGRFGKEMLKGFNAIISIGKTSNDSEKNSK